MQFGILGHLEIWSGDRRLDLGGNRRRALLAYLLIHRRWPVPLERMCNDIWDGQPSSAAAATVKTYISQLRKVLAADQGDVRVVSRSHGYLLELRDEQLDATRFERLVQQATTSITSFERLAHLEDALSLWRGPALVEFKASDWSLAEGIRLDAARLRAETQRLELLLELGRHEAALPDLERLVSEHPLDESVVALLAHARYLSGSPAAALAALSSVRRTLATELGVDPGAEISRIEQRILDHDPTLWPGDPAADDPMSPKAWTAPAGIVTFLFTDMEASTPLLEHLGQASYAQVLEAQRSIVHEVADAHGGWQFGTGGDAVYLAFVLPSDAVAAARIAQERLCAHPWPVGGEVRVRMGVHTGEAEVIDGDYIGMALHVVARVCEAAHGGQVLLTETTATLVPELEARDLGEHHLRGVSRPVRLLQLLGDLLPDGFPPPRTMGAHPNNLPASVDMFVGRRDELVEVRRALQEHRLVTLTGTGGAGKTRLALEAAGSALEDFPDGVWLTELAPLADRSRLAAGVAGTWGLGEQRDRTIRQTLLTWLGPRALLLVLDNCEHLTDEVGTLVTDLLRAAPNVRILATSREALRVRGECTVMVAPLTAGAEADLLFEIRARAAAPDVDLSDRAVVTRVCARLDGVPLAIELAAARLGGLSLLDLSDHLDDRFKLLAGARPADAPHHRTLHAVVDWSYALLDSGDQEAFRRCAAFGDSFDVVAAASVIGGAWSPIDVLDALTRLVEKSLVSRSAVAEGATRYQMLETLRQYGREHLTAADEAEETLDRLLGWALGKVETLEAAMRTSDQDATIRRTLPDRANLRLAMDRALECGNHLAALRLVSTVPVGLPRERRLLIAQLVENLGEREPRFVAQAHLTSANLSMEQGDWAAARSEARQASEGFTMLGEHRLAAWGRFFESFGAWGAGDLAATKGTIDELLDAFRELGDDFGLAYSLWVASQLESDLDRAALMGAEADGLLRALGARFALAHDLEGRALIAVQAQRADRASGFLLEALLILSDAANLGCTAHCLEAIGALLVERGRPLIEVAELVGAAEVLRETSGHEHRPWELRGHHAVLEALTRTDDRDTIHEAINRGRGHGLVSAVERAQDLLLDAAPSPEELLRSPHPHGAWPNRAGSR